MSGAIGFLRKSPRVQLHPTRLPPRLALFSRRQLFANAVIAVLARWLVAMRRLRPLYAAGGGGGGFGGLGGSMAVTHSPVGRSGGGVRPRRSRRRSIRGEAGRPRPPRGVGRAGAL